MTKLLPQVKILFKTKNWVLWKTVKSLIFFQSTWRWYDCTSHTLNISAYINKCRKQTVIVLYLLLSVWRLKTYNLTFKFIKCKCILITCVPYKLSIRISKHKNEHRFVPLNHFSALPTAHQKLIMFYLRTFLS